MEIHFEDGFPSVERRVLPQNPNSHIPDLKIKIRIRQSQALRFL